MKKASPTLLREFHGNTKPAEEFGYGDDQKRLWREFDAYVKLRWHPRKKMCQVWYRSPNDCYPICDISAPYNICKAIKFMKDKEKSRKQIMMEWKQGEAAEEMDRRRHIKDVAYEVGTATKNVMNGKVSVLMR